LTYMVVDLVFSTYGYVFHEYYPEVRDFCRCVWLPHSASPDFVIPFNPEAENTLLLSGAISGCYPLREKMKALCDTGRHRIVHHPHPGYGTHFDNDADRRVGQGYGRLINGCRAAFTDCSNYRYTVAKHFEIPAAGALLLADRAIAGPLEELGFVAGEHYIATSAEDLEDQVHYILEASSNSDIDAIRLKAQSLVWEKHKTSDRAALIDDVCRTALLI
jgi:Glycosyl transferases group 1